MSTTVRVDVNAFIAGWKPAMESVGDDAGSLSQALANDFVRELTKLHVSIVLTQNEITAIHNSLYCAAKTMDAKATITKALEAISRELIEKEKPQQAPSDEVGPVMNLIIACRRAIESGAVSISQTAAFILQTLRYGLDARMFGTNHIDYVRTNILPLVLNVADNKRLVDELIEIEKVIDPDRHLVKLSDMTAQQANELSIILDAPVHSRETGWAISADALREKAKKVKLGKALPKYTVAIPSARGGIGLGSLAAIDVAQWSERQTAQERTVEIAQAIVKHSAGKSKVLFEYIFRDEMPADEIFFIFGSRAKRDYFLKAKETADMATRRIPPQSVKIIAFTAEAEDLMAATVTKAHDILDNK